MKNRLVVSGTRERDTYARVQQPDASKRYMGVEARIGPEREESTKFISGHPRAEPRGRGQIPSRASPSFANGHTGC